MMPAEMAVRRHLKHLALEGKSPITIRHRRDAIARLERALPVPLLDATADHLYDWRETLTQKNGTVALYVSHIKCFYDWAVTERLIETNPAVATPVPKLPRRYPRPIPEADLMHAYASTSPAMFVRYALLLGAWCGLRCQEIAGLRRQGDQRWTETEKSVSALYAAQFGSRTQGDKP
jgi:integrase